MGKKGFTLVELLAVIAIIAVLGIITIPMVMTTVEEANKSAFTSSAQNVLDTAKAYVTRIEETGNFPDEGVLVSDLKSELKNFNYISGIILKEEDGSIIVDGLSDGKYCASGTKNNLRVVKGDCSSLDNTPPTVKVLLNKRTSTSITILVNASDATSGIYGYSYSIDGVHYSEIKQNNIYTVDGLEKNETVTIYVRVYNNRYDKTNSEENLTLSMTEQFVEFTTLEIEKPKFVISTSESSATTVKLVDIIYPENIGEYEYSYEIDGVEEIVNGNKVRLTITNNSIIKARIKTSTEIIENELRIAGLDNEGPEANIVYNQNWETSKKIKIEVTYEQTGLPNEPYSYDGGRTWTSNNEKVYVSGEVVQNKIQVRDILGNITTKLKVNGEETEEIIIDYVDNEKPSCSLQVIKGTEGTNGWYTSNIEIGFNETKDVAKYCNNGVCEETEPGSGIKNSNVDITQITKDGTTTVTGTVVDNVGNKGTCTLTIQKDANKPVTPTITSSDGKVSGEWHSANYNLTFSGSNSISGVQYQYSTDGQNYINGNSISVSNNTSGVIYYVRTCSHAGICSEVTSYQAKLDKDIPSVPTITSSDGIKSGNWHNTNFSLVFSGSSSVSGIIYQYSTNGVNYTNGSKVNIASNTSTTYYVRSCNGSGLCSLATTYEVKLDKTVPSISAKNAVVYLGFQASKNIVELFNIGSYGISGGTTTCYLIQNNRRSKVVSNNNVLNLGINIIECEAVTGSGNKANSRVTIKHQYSASPYCAAGTYQNGTCYFESNASVCGTEQKPVTTQVYSSCATTVNTCQYGCDTVWNANINCTTVQDTNNCIKLKCTLCSYCSKLPTNHNKGFDSSSKCVSFCDKVGGRCSTTVTGILSTCHWTTYDTYGQSCEYCGSETVYSNDRCAGKKTATCTQYGTKQVCSGGYEQTNCSSCKTGSYNECRAGYITTTTIETVAASCNKAEYIRYSCTTSGINTNNNQTISASTVGSICQF